MSDYSLLELYKHEIETHGAVLNEGLLAFEADTTNASAIEAFMRAAHSVKGAARIIGIDIVADVAHHLEEVFVLAGKETIQWTSDSFNGLYAAVDLLLDSGKYSASEMDAWVAKQEERSSQIIVSLKAIVSGETQSAQVNIPEPTESKPLESEAIPSPVEFGLKDEEAFVRVSTDNLNHLMGLAAESLIQTKQFDHYREQLLSLKKAQSELASRFDQSLQHFHDDVDEEVRLEQFTQLHESTHAMLNDMRKQLEAFDAFSRQHSVLSDRLYWEVLACRMRPFSEGVQSFPRLVRDLSRGLKKEIRLVIEGGATMVDRDILEQLEAPLNHIIRNACDHGIESPEQREEAGKNRNAVVTLAAHHHAGILLIEVKDDGGGIDCEKLRFRVVERELVTAEIAMELKDDELLEFLFLPGFSTAKAVTDISGRGVGLDVVRSMVQSAGGSTNVSSVKGEGTTFTLKLPITRSVLSSLLVTIDSEPYAFALSRIERVLTLPKEALIQAEGQQCFDWEGSLVPLTSAQAVLGFSGHCSSIQKSVDVVMIEVDGKVHGFEVDSLDGETDLVVRPLDSRLGKVPSVSAVSVLEDGHPIVILDVEDMVRSAHKVAKNGHIDMLHQSESMVSSHQQKKLLVVEDSPTVRETERKLLEQAGYSVELAVDGMDGWNAVRLDDFDLVLTDIDMPRMNGFELLENIKQHDALKDIPVIIISYKDRTEDYNRGMDLGADAYLTKTSVSDESFVDAVNVILEEEP